MRSWRASQIRLSRTVSPSSRYGAAVCSVRAPRVTRPAATARRRAPDGSCAVRLASDQWKRVPLGRCRPPPARQHPGPYPRPERSAGLTAWSRCQVGCLDRGIRWSLTQAGPAAAIVGSVLRRRFVGGTRIMRGEARRRVGCGFGLRLGEQVVLVGVPLGVAACWYRLWTDSGTSTSGMPVRYAGRLSAPAAVPPDRPCPVSPSGAGRTAPNRLRLLARPSVDTWPGRRRRRSARWRPGSPGTPAHHGSRT
jgi:hypothetical protein